MHIPRGRHGTRGLPTAQALPDQALPDLHNLTIDAVRADGGRGRTPHMRRLTRSRSLSSNVRLCRSPGLTPVHGDPGGSRHLTHFFRCRVSGLRPGPRLSGIPFLQVSPFRPATGPALRDPISSGAAFPAGDRAGSQGPHFFRCRLSGGRPGRLPQAHPFPRCRLSRQSPTATTLHNSATTSDPRHTIGTNLFAFDDERVLFRCRRGL
jgi:hypothetical protein